MAFIFSVQTTGTNDTFTFPTISNGTYDCHVDWGDSSSDDITTYNDPAWTHTYATEDEYTITITGTCYGICFNNGGDCLMMRDISDWGSGVFRLGATTSHFYGCSNMTCSDTTGAPDITGVTSLYSCWRNCSSLTTLGDLSAWNVSSVTSFNSCWYDCSSLTTLGDLSAWNVSSVASFNSCWYGCSSLTTLGDLSAWDVSSVTSFSVCWRNCSSLTTLGDLSAWNVSSVTTFYLCWYDCSSLTTLGDLSAWDVSSVTSLYSCWYDCSSLTTLGDLSAWNVSSVASLYSCWYGCSSLTTLGDLSAWNVSSVTSFNSCWRNCSSLTTLGDLSAWDVSSVTAFNSCWDGCSALTSEQYSRIILGWSSLSLQSGVTAHFGSATYYADSSIATARLVLTSTYSWTITDGGVSTDSWPDINVQDIKLLNACVLPYGAFFTDQGNSYSNPHEDVTFCWDGSDTLSIGFGRVTSVGDYSTDGPIGTKAFNPTASTGYATAVTSGNISAAEGSLQFWVQNVAALTGDATFFYGNANFKVWWDDSDNDIVFSYGATPDTVRTATAITDAGWHHVLIEWDASALLRITVDGYNQGELTSGVDAAPTLDTNMYFNADDASGTNIANVPTSDWQIISRVGTPQIWTALGHGPLLLPQLEIS